MRKLKVDREVGWGIFIIDGHGYVWDENDDGKYVLKGNDGEVLEIFGDERDENDHVKVFFVV